MRPFGFLPSATLAISAMLALVVALLGTSVPSLADPWQADIEKELAGFDPAHESDIRPVRGEVVATMDLTGTWVRGESGYDNAELDFVPDASGHYRVAFRTAGCLGSWSLQRHAQFGGGTVTLDAPVQEYAPATYTRLHAVRLYGQDYLLPSTEVERFNRGDDVEWLAYRRATGE